MSWLLWREYRLNRWILITAAAAIMLSCVIGFLLNLFHVDEELANVVWAAAFVWSFLAVALLSGNAFAGERADRSAEFIDCLPLERSRRVASKLLLHLIVAGVLMIANLLLLRHLIGIAEFAAGVGLALVIYCVNWLVSSIQSSPALATMSGFATLGLFGLIGALLEEWTMIPNRSIWLHNMSWFFFAVFVCLVPIVCFSVGTRYYLRDAKP